MTDGPEVYGPEEVSRALSRIVSGTASFDTRAALEHHVLTVLREGGTPAVAALLDSIPGHDFETFQADDPEGFTRFVALRDGPDQLVVETFVTPGALSVDVRVESESGDARPAPDPRHEAFYAIWESLIGMEDSAVSQLDSTRRAVYLIGLLEAEVMNGGLGQYLTNTDGIHVEATIRCLTEIGAERSCALLREAVALRTPGASYVDVWDTRSDDFVKLDDRFLEEGEDLAGMTADRFLE